MASRDANLLSKLLALIFPEWEQMVTRGCLSLDHPNGDMVVIFTAKRRWGWWGSDAEGWPLWVESPNVYKGRGWREWMVEDILEHVKDA